LMRSGIQFPTSWACVAVGLLILLRLGIALPRPSQSPLLLAVQTQSGTPAGHYQVSTLDPTTGKVKPLFPFWASAWGGFTVNWNGAGTIYTYGGDSFGGTWLYTLDMHGTVGRNFSYPQAISGFLIDSNGTAYAQAEWQLAQAIIAIDWEKGKVNYIHKFYVYEDEDNYAGPAVINSRTGVICVVVEHDDGGGLWWTTLASVDVHTKKIVREFGWNTNSPEFTWDPTKELIYAFHYTDLYELQLVAYDGGLTNVTQAVIISFGKEDNGGNLVYDPFSKLLFGMVEEHSSGDAKVWVLLTVDMTTGKILNKIPLNKNNFPTSFVVIPPSHRHLFQSD